MDCRGAGGAEIGLVRHRMSRAGRAPVAVAALVALSEIGGAGAGGGAGPARAAARSARARQWPAGQWAGLPPAGRRRRPPCSAPLSQAGLRPGSQPSSRTRLRTGARVRRPWPVRRWFGCRAAVGRLDARFGGGWCCGELSVAAFAARQGIERMQVDGHLRQRGRGRAEQTGEQDAGSSHACQDTEESRVMTVTQAVIVHPHGDFVRCPAPRLRVSARVQMRVGGDDVAGIARILAARDRWRSRPPRAPAAVPAAMSQRFSPSSQ